MPAIVPPRPTTRLVFRRRLTRCFVQLVWSFALLTAALALLARNATLALAGSNPFRIAAYICGALAVLCGIAALVLRRVEEPRAKLIKEQPYKGSVIH